MLGRILLLATLVGASPHWDVTESCESCGKGAHFHLILGNVCTKSQVNDAIWFSIISCDPDTFELVVEEHSGFPCDESNKLQTPLRLNYNVRQCAPKSDKTLTNGEIAAIATGTGVFLVTAYGVFKLACKPTKIQGLLL